MKASVKFTFLCFFLATGLTLGNAEYGFPQRRRRVFIVGELSKGTSDNHPARSTAEETIFANGILAQALPVREPEGTRPIDLVSGFPLSDRPLDKVGSQTDDEIASYLGQISEAFGADAKKTRFRNAGVMIDGSIYTIDVKPVDLGEGQLAVWHERVVGKAQSA